MTEAETRASLIDKRLLASGWDVSDHAKVVEEYALNGGSSVQYTNASYNATQFSDYILLGRDGKPLAVVEAKRTSKDAELGREQAKQYALRIQKESNIPLPFCFYTNGNDIFFWDIGNYPPRKIHSFPTREDLERLRHIKTYKKPLSHQYIDTKIAGRDYQIGAIRSVMEGIDKKRRNFLLVMATGTGKTRTTIALVDALEIGTRGAPNRRLEGSRQHVRADSRPLNCTFAPTRLAIRTRACAAGGGRAASPWRSSRAARGGPARRGGR
jgi:type I restriction enzyme R subunit